ncbi:MAG: hypothetical protein COA77_08850 [Thaumarchaeota archaeon]|nr:MAG: hypothetical protein COA77_08850 [Nitrososphaerota archaeon]
MASTGVELDKITTKQFDDFLIIPFSKEWLSLNDGKQIEFSIHVTENNLVLSGKLASLDRTKDVDTNVM